MKSRLEFTPSIFISTCKKLRYYQRYIYCYILYVLLYSSDRIYINNTKSNRENSTMIKTYNAEVYKFGYDPSFNSSSAELRRPNRPISQRRMILAARTRALNNVQLGEFRRDANTKPLLMIVLSRLL